MNRSNDSPPQDGHSSTAPDRHSALLLIDLQNDYFPGGTLGVPDAQELIPTINRVIGHFSRNGWAILATRDWHPANHCSFNEQHGSLPVHCVQGSKGAQFHSALVLPPGMMVISKGTLPKQDSSSCFEESSLEERLEDLHVNTLWILGLGTTECLKKTVADACRLQLRTIVLSDAMKTYRTSPQCRIDLFQEIKEIGAALLSVKELSLPAN